mgnify:FL=1
MSQQKYHSSIYILIFSSFLVLSNCKSSQPISSSAVANKSVSAKQLINTYQNKLSNFKTLNGRMSIGYEKGSNSKSVGVSFRMEKDKHIWMSAPLGVGKVLITPSRVSFYNKLDKVFFDGDFSYLSNLLGTKLDFEKLQNILLGQAIYDLKKQAHKISIANNSYVLKPKRQKPLFDLEYMINPSYFKLDALSVTQKFEQRDLKIFYKSYQNLRNLVLPKIISILANEGKDIVKIDLEYKSLRLNENLRFPYKIPDGYKAFKF